MESWVILGLLSAVTAALVAIFGKVGLEGVDSTIASGVRAVVMVVVVLGVILFSGRLNEIPEVIKNGRALFYIVLGGIAGGLSWIFYFAALKLGEASKVAPLDRLSVVFVLVFSILFLGEKLTWNLALGVGLMTAGAILVVL